MPCWVMCRPFLERSGSLGRVPLRAAGPLKQAHEGACGVVTVALESADVCGIPGDEVLERLGLKSGWSMRGR
jgi:hypothetical protein